MFNESILMIVIMVISAHGWLVGSAFHFPPFLLNTADPIGIPLFIINDNA